MNILYVSSDNDIYHGAFLSMVRLAEIMQKKHHHYVKIILPYEGNGTNMIKQKGIPFSLIHSYDWIIKKDEENNPLVTARELTKTILNIRAIKRIEKIIVKDQIDIVHINTSWCYVGGISAINKKCKLVWHIREFLEEDQNVCIWNKKLGYKLINRANRIIAISNSIKQKYDGIIDPYKLSVVLNGIDPEQYLNLGHEIMCKETFSFLVVGNIIEGKRQKEVVQACMKLHDKKIDNFTLKIVGNNSDAYAQELMDYVVSNNASDYILFLGKKEHPETLYQESDITFMSSIAEAFGRVTVEAMLGGSLVIGARCAGTLDIIKENETGLMYTPGDIEDLCAKIVYAVNHKQQMKAIANAGRRDMMTRLTADKNAYSINEIYKELMIE